MTPVTNSRSGFKGNPSSDSDLEDSVEDCANTLGWLVCGDPKSKKKIIQIYRLILVKILLNVPGVAFNLSFIPIIQSHHCQEIFICLFNAKNIADSVFPMYFI